MTDDGMDLIVSFFHDDGNFARARELREALDEFETRMPDRIKSRLRSKLPAEEIAPTSWGPFQEFSSLRATYFRGLGWGRRAQGSADLAEWVGFGWYQERNRDYLSNPQDQPRDPSRWVGWWKPDVEDRSLEEARLFDRACTILGDRVSDLFERRFLDAEPQYGGGWPYFYGVPAAEAADVLRVDTDEFAAALSKVLPAIRRAVEQID